MYFRKLFHVFVLTLVPGLSYGAGLELLIQSRAVSEPMAIEAYGDDWRGTLHSGDTAWTRNRVELAASHGNWQVGYVQRYDYIIRTNEDTADLHYRDENNLPAPEGDVHFRLHAWHLRAQGAKFKYFIEGGKGFYFQPAISLLQGGEFQDGSIHGLLTNNGGLAGQGDISYRYTEDKLLDHQFKKPDGLGLALDLLIGWQQANKHAQLNIEDLYGRMWWEDAPYTRGVLDTVNRGDPERVHLDPAFSGRRDLENYAQRMPVYVTASYRQNEGFWAWHLDGEYFISRLWVRPGLSLPRVPLNPYIGYEARSEQWLLGLTSDEGAFHFRLGSDTSDFSETRSLTLELGFVARW